MDDVRVLNAMTVENRWRDCPARYRDENMRGAARAIRIRMEDAAGLASVKLALDALNGGRPAAYSQCAAYWAALP